MERLRLWIQTLSLLALAGAMSAYVLRSAFPVAHADDPPVCKYLDSSKFVFGPAVEEVTAQATALLAAQAGKQHVVAIPYGRMGNGSGTFATVVCVW